MIKMGITVYNDIARRSAAKVITPSKTVRGVARLGHDLSVACSPTGRFVT